MTIKVGDKLPDATFMTLTAEGPKPLTTSEVFGGKKVVMFAVPGAFTPTCHNTHLPGFIQMAGDMKSKGIDTIACVAVNDAFVLGAWAKQTGAEGKIIFLADGAADFTKKIGLEFDLTARGLGVRSRRYSMVVEDGTVKSLNLEEGAVVDKSSAATVCTML